MLIGKIIHTPRQIGAPSQLLFWGLLLSVLALFFSSNYLKLGSLFLTALYIALPVKKVWRYRGEKLELYLLLPCIIGLLFAWKNQLADTVRDILFFLIPYIYFMAGKRFFKQGGNIRQLIFGYSKIYCAIFLLLLCFFWFEMGFIGVLQIRDFVSPGSFLLVYCIVMLYEKRKSWKQVLHNPWFIAVHAVFLAQFSRTYVLILAAFFLLSGRKIIDAKIMWRALALFILAAAVAGAFGLYDLIGETLHKAISELHFNEEWTQEDIGTSYRAYEIFASFREFKNYPVLNEIFGGGFGALVHLDFPVPLGGAEYSEIPWMHNGYLYILVKSGLAGLLCYFIFLLKMFRRAKHCTAPHGRMMILGSIAGLLLSNMVICGIFSNESVFCYIVLGYFSSFLATKKTGSH
ncbi:O-antigen ligase family protein [Janthinobacterium sp. SUN033]|uniref:O-antigen ligase family protein n=1 Tax=Janthinobacterium sp. SUN033 TaxID=3002439 RepID=UPI0025B02812|nr:O-antigen ligase family protein [Janthinobacterium sp. SUN033]MDN2677713.1 O-antigen ligase family protein [Janthinobacterium sp. SUN033]